MAFFSYLDIGAVGRFGEFFLALLDKVELEAELIDRNLVLARVVLRDTSEETLCEVEAGEPEDDRRA